LTNILQEAYTICVGFFYDYLIYIQVLKRYLVQKLFIMTTQEISTALVDFCRQGKFKEARTALYSADVESIEPAHTPMPYVKGLDALEQKADAFNSSVEAFHNSYVSDPLVAGNFFTLVMGIDATYKEYGRMNMEEVVVYEVKDGKVVKETFYY
jgi:hypothetical protein